MAQMLAMVCNEHHRMPITTPLAPPRSSPPMESISDACRATNHSDLCRTPYTAAAHRCRSYLHCRPCGRRRRRDPCTAPAGHSAHASLTTATSVARRKLPQHTAAAVTFAATPVAASTAAPVAASTAAPVAASTAAPVAAPAAAVLPAPLRQQNPALTPCTFYGSDSALAPCTSAAFIAPTAPLRQQNPALAPSTCYGSDSALDQVPRRLSSPPLRRYGSRTWPSRHVPRRFSSPPLCRYGNRIRPSRHVPATAAKLSPRAMYLGGFHRPHCAATATDLGPRAMYLLRQQHPALAPFISGTSDSDHSRRSDHDRRDHR